MKTSLILLLTVIFNCLALGQDLPKIKIATYDSNQLQKKVGYQALRELEYGSKYRNSIISLNQKLKKLEDLLIKAENDEDLKRVNLELSFIKSKMSSIQSLAQTRANRGNDRIELSSLIKKSFEKKYAVIIQKGSSSNAFHNAIHANIEYVDITDEIAALVRKALSEVSDN